MKEIVNRTHRPIRVPLPGGKFLHLGPAKSGQVSDQAIQAPSFQKLLKSGTIELLGEGNRSVDAPQGPATPETSTHGHKPTTVVTPKGNR
jgi:hypothetical protein